MALRRGDVHVAGGAADEGAAGEAELGDRLHAAGGQRARAVADAASRRQEARDRGVLLEALELAEGGERGVLVVEVDDEAEVHFAVRRVVGEAAAAGRVVERVAEIVVDAAGLMN